MVVKSLTKWILGLAVVAGASMLGTSTAEAHWFHHGSCGSSGGSWGSSGGSSGGSWGSSGGSWGSSGGSWGSSGGSWGSSGGSWGSSGGSWGSGGSCGSCYTYTPCCSSCGGSYGGEYYTPVAPMQSAPMTPGAPSTAPSAPTPPPVPGNGRSTYNGDAAYLMVSVPTDAKVFVNDRATVSTGSDRQYVSHGLEQGMRYEYTVRVEMVRDGKPVTETKTVQLTAGNSTNVNFNAEKPAPQTAKSGESPRTAVKLHVPADAKVFLAGQEMKSSGTEREFSTNKLAAGAQWENYNIRVVSQGETQDKTLSLKGGESRDVSFDFPAHVASAR